MTNKSNELTFLSYLQQNSNSKMSDGYKYFEGNKEMEKIYYLSLYRKVSKVQKLSTKNVNR